jgi:glycosyltransferase involved in cell wall biosynthesis
MHAARQFRLSEIPRRGIMSNAAEYSVAPPTRPVSHDLLPGRGAVPRLHVPEQINRDGEIRPREANPRVSVVMPTLNEEKNLEWVLGRLPTDLHEIVLVDGRSTDATIATATRLRPDIRIVLQKTRGKGAALALGLAEVTGDIAVIIDADGSMDPAEIPGMVGALLSGADVVKGSRAAAGGGSEDLTTLRTLGNWGLTFLANRVYRQHWRELCYGYAALWTDVLPLLGITEITGSARNTAPGAGPAYGHGFEIEAILFCRSARANLRIAEVFSYEHERRNGESNLATWRDGWRVLTALRRERHYRFADANLNRDRRTYPLLPHLHDTDRSGASPMDPEPQATRSAPC